MKTGCNRNKGFTLIELLMVLAILAIISGMAFTSYRMYIDKARLTVSVNALTTMRKTMENYALEHQSYPVTIDFSTFTDQDGTPITDAGTITLLRDGTYSLDSYISGPNTYTLVARALDSKHTVVTVTPANISY